MHACAPQAILAATRGSFAALQRRLGAGAAAGGTPLLGLPVFAAAVELSVPSVGLSPSLDAMQDCIDAAAQQVRGALLESFGHTTC
jgi:hypothetical protein